jgi:Fis family transcriptional regulator
MTATMHYKKPDAKTKKIILKDKVSEALDQYFTTLGDEKPTNLYKLVLSEVEAGILEATMKFTEQNQSQASIILDLNRGTFRKKLIHYGMLGSSSKVGPKTKSTTKKEEA